jgi:hypothetical protein
MVVSSDDNLQYIFDNLTYRNYFNSLFDHLDEIFSLFNIFIFLEHNTYLEANCSLRVQKIPKFKHNETAFWVLGFCTMCEDSLLTTFRNSLLVSHLPVMIRSLSSLKLIRLMSNEDVTHSEFRNVSKLVSHIVQKPKKRRKLKINTEDSFFYWKCFSVGAFLEAHKWFSHTNTWFI